MTKTCLLDYDSIAGADKFGNIFVLRVPSDVSDDVDNPTGAVSSSTPAVFFLHFGEFPARLCLGCRPCFRK